MRIGAQLTARIEPIHHVAKQARVCRQTVEVIHAGKVPRDPGHGSPADLPRHHGGRVRVLHVDVQGEEARVLRGGQTSFTQGLVKNVFLATHSDVLHYECFEFLQEHGFTVVCSQLQSRAEAGYDGIIVATSVALPSPRVLSRKEIPISPWVRLAEKEIEFAPGQPPQVYHCVAQQDYITVLARTPSGRFPIVRQFRPAVETYTWELPAGLLEKGENPAEACRRELKEETGLEALSTTPLGSYYADTGRMENKQHAFFVEASEPDPCFVAEAGMTIDYVTLPELKARVRAQEFHLQLHIGVVFLHELLLNEQAEHIKSSRS